MNKIVIRLFCLMLMTAVCCYAAFGADNAPAGSGTFDFDNITEAEALRIVSQDTGIVIKAPFDLLQKKVRKNYMQVSVDEIVTDLLRRRNYAIIWYYDDHQLVTIDIRIDEQTGQAGDLPPALAPGQSGRAVSGKASSRQRALPPAIAPGRYRGVERPPMPPGI